MSSYATTSKDLSPPIPVNGPRRDTLGELQEIYRSVFEEATLTAAGETQLRDHESWDWPTHAAFFLEVERVLQVLPSVSEMAYLKTFGELADLIDSKRGRHPRTRPEHRVSPS